MDQLNVVCVNVNNYLGRGVDYVNALRANVRQHLKVKHRFYCITDESASETPRLRCKPADPRLKGWWQKLALFKPGQFPEGHRILFLDLDTILVDNIDFLADYQGDFAILHDFWRPEGLGPAVMLWKAGWADFIWQEFESSGLPMTDPRGDQGWIENRNQGRIRKEVDILQDLYPGKFVSYKTSCTKSVPEGAAVVCFHGLPRPHECGGWVKEAWHGHISG